jgi:hypothetical protein
MQMIPYLTIIAQVILGISIFIFIAHFATSFSAYRAFKKYIQIDQEHSEKGDVVLLRDSLLAKILDYADKDFQKEEAPADDPLRIYSALSATRYIFILSQVILLLTLVGVGIALFMSLTGSESSDKKDFIEMAFPMLISLLLSIMMIVYVKAIYQRLYVNQAFEYMKLLKNQLNNLHSSILNAVSPSTDSEFCLALQNKDATQKSIHDMIKNTTRTETLKARLVSMSIREYFMSEVPDYNNSPISTLFHTDAEKRLSNPGNFIRIDCTRTLQNYSYKYPELLSGITKMEERRDLMVLISTEISNINQKISDIRMKSPPMITLLENFFRISSYFFFMMVVIVLSILIGWYGWWCKVKKVLNFFTYQFQKLKIRITKKGEEKKIEREDALYKLKEEYERAQDKACLSDKGPNGAVNTSSGGTPPAPPGPPEPPVSIPRQAELLDTMPTMIPDLSKSLTSLASSAKGNWRNLSSFKSIK